MRALGRSPNPLRERTKDDLITFLRAKVGRWDSVWWNGELITIGEALGRASELLPTEQVLCARDEVLLPSELERATSSFTRAL
jgi:hypothetical protein